MWHAHVDIFLTWLATWTPPKQFFADWAAPSQPSSSSSSSSSFFFCSSSSSSPSRTKFFSSSSSSQAAPSRAAPPPPFPHCIFLSAFRYATSSPTVSMRELKSSAQDQLEYMLTEDDDPPLLAFDNDTKSEVKNCVANQLARFSDFLDFFSTKSTAKTLNVNMREDLQSYLCDVSWVSQILSKMEMIKDFVHYWVGASSSVVRAVEVVSTGSCNLEARVKMVEITAKVLEAAGFELKSMEGAGGALGVADLGNIILPAEMRHHVVNTWIPFVQRTKPLVEQVDLNDDEVAKTTLDSEI